jgi:RHS repeat-associated protein
MKCDRSFSTRTSRTETTSLATKKDTYSYDPISQLTNVAYAGGTKVAYAYDPVGNRTSVSTSVGKTNTVIPYLANNCNQYTQVGSLLVSSDRNGNLTSDQKGNSYTYDAQNRLVKVVTGGSNSTVVTMAYDAQNRCVSRSINGQKDTFVYDGWKLVEEYDSYGTEEAYYINGPGADEILTRNPTLGGAAYYTQDGNGNVTTITDVNGNVQERYTYDVYGTPTIANAVGTTITTSAMGNRFLFTGREYISQIGLYDYRNRVYSPGLGRFLQTDSLRFDAGDVNIYRYCGNSPTDWNDPSGEWTLTGTVGVGFAVQMSVSYNPTGHVTVTQSVGAGEGASIQYSTKSTSGEGNGVSGNITASGTVGLGKTIGSLDIGGSIDTHGTLEGTIGGQAGNVGAELTGSSKEGSSVSNSATFGESTFAGVSLVVDGETRPHESENPTDTNQKTNKNKGCNCL